MDLFLDKVEDIGFFKMAAFAARVSETPDNWPQELTSEMMRQLPYLSDYEVNVNLQSTDPQRGYGFGYADVTSRTERPESEHPGVGIPHIRIPLIIKDRAVKPFNVFLDGERVVPLTEERARQALFNPQAFDLSSSAPRDPSLVEAMMPPTRTGPGMGGEYKVASVLHEIAGTIRQSDAQKFISKVASDANLIAGFRRSGVAGTLVSVFDSIEDEVPGSRLAKVASSVEPTVVTMLKLPGGSFLVKSAATDAFAGGQQAQGQVVPQQQAAEMIGAQNAQAMLPGQSATAVSNPVPPPQPQAPVAEETDNEVADQFGQWMVQDLMGNRLSGWVFPNTLSWDGNFTPQPMALFTNGSAYAFQDSIAGELVGKSTILPSDVPRGDGCFYLIKGGKAIATQPVTIASSMSGPDGLPKFSGTDAFGKSLQVSFVPGIKEPTRLSDVEFGFPDTWKFMRLNNQTQLVNDPVQINKTASVRSDLGSVELIYNGAYHLRGGCGLDKVAYELKHDLDPVSAEFMLGVLGVDGITSKTKIAEARRRGLVKMAGLRSITTLEERLSSNVKTASAILSQVPDLRCDLVKEAAALDDESTINNVLALNFINPENLHTFINYLPDLEMTSERLAEMWLYSVMGMTELPEEHIERAMKNMENVIEGLKAIAHAEI